MPLCPSRSVCRCYSTTSTLQLEPRRVIRSILGPYALDINLDASDPVNVASSENAEEGRESALTLEGARDVDVGAVKAEWKVSEGIITVYAYTCTLPYPRAFVVCPDGLLPPYALTLGRSQAPRYVCLHVHAMLTLRSIRSWHAYTIVICPKTSEPALVTVIVSIFIDFIQ
jgi:hypothetical protein